jgi:PilZ domain
MLTWMVSQSELEALLETLARDQRVNLGVGDASHRVWFRAQVISHDASSGRLILTCFMDRPTDRPLEPGERVVVAANRSGDDESAPMHVEWSGDGSAPEVHLRMAGAWARDDERRQQERVPLNVRANRARRWVGGAWRDLEALLVDLSSRGVGLNLDREVHVGDRVSLVIPMTDGGADLRVTVEIRHVRVEPNTAHWRAGGLFRNLTPADHERVIRLIFAELRSRRTL